MIRHNNFRSEKGVKEKAVKTVFTRILSIMLTIGIVCPSITPLGAYLGANATEEEMAAEIMTEYDEAEEETEPAEEIIDEENIEITEEETVSEEETAVTDEENNSEEDTDLTEETIDEEKTGIVEEIVERIEDTGFQMMMAVNMVRILADGTADPYAGKTYRIHVNNSQRAQNNGKDDYVLTLSGNTLIQDEKNDTDNMQYFTFEKSASGHYYLKNCLTDQYAVLNGELKSGVELIFNNTGDKFEFDIVNSGKGSPYIEFVSVNNRALKLNATQSTNTDIQHQVSLYSSSRSDWNEAFDLIPFLDPYAGKTYSIKNMNPAQQNPYLSVNGSSINGISIALAKEVEGDNQAFQLIYSGDGMYYYIKNVGTESYATKTGTSIYFTDLSNGDNQKFIIENKNEYLMFIAKEKASGIAVAIDANANGTINFYNKKENTSNNKENQYFTLETYVKPAPIIAIKTDPDKEIKIEARVIFGDYNNGKYKDGTTLKNEDHVYKGLSDKISISLRYRGQEWNGSQYKIDTVHPEQVDDTTEARKDWCYQYNNVWTVNPFVYDDVNTKNNTGYYVQLEGTNNGKITYNIKETKSDGTTITYQQTFNVYYLTDDYLKHPGGDVSPYQYPTEGRSQVSNDNRIIYIFLDPEQDWSHKGNGTNDQGTTGIPKAGEYHKPNTFSLSMKKRWDGHNSGGFKNRPKEKIKIQLQRWIPDEDAPDDLTKGTWAEFSPDIFDEAREYTYTCYFEVADPHDPEHQRKQYVDLRYFIKGRTGNDPGKTITEAHRVYNDGNPYYIINVNGEEKTFDEDDFDYDTLSRYENCLFESEGDVNQRAKLQLDYAEWNNVVLTLFGENHPAHFTAGYYFNWNNIPYGHYRVIETLSFYDTDDNNVFDEKIDRDTSQEYYYMEFPPSRDSSGVLHIQNFTKDMVLDVEKEWYDDDNGNNKIPSPATKPIVFDVYRSLSQTSYPNIKMDYVGRYVTGNDGKIELKTTQQDINKITHPELELRNDNGEKYYYYIREVGVKKADGSIDTNSYKQIGDSVNGFVKNEYGTYGADFESGDARKYIIKNKQHTGINIEKKYKVGTDSNGKAINVPYAQLNGDKPEVKFEVYKGSSIGEPTKDGNQYKVNGTPLTKISGDTPLPVDENGQLRLVDDDCSDIKIFGDDQYYEGKDSDVFDNARVDNGDIKWNNGGYYEIPGDPYTRNFGIKANNYGGVLEIKFISIQPNDRITWQEGNQTAITIQPSQLKASTDNEYILLKEIKPGITYTIQKPSKISTDGCDPKMEYIKFKPYNYYYIREITSDEDKFTLVNGNDYGFITPNSTDPLKTNGNNYCFNLTSDNPFYFATAVNEPKMELTLNKKWYADEDNELSVEAMDIMNEDQKTATFEIYRSDKDGNNEKVSSYTLPSNVQGVTKNSNNNSFSVTGNVNDIKITGLDVYKEINGKYYQYSYYIKEVKNDNYKLLNDNNEDGCIDDKGGVVYTDTNKTFTFQNQPVINVTVKKVWEDGEDKHSNDSVSVNIIKKIDNSFKAGERVSILSNEQVSRLSQNNAGSSEFSINVPSRVVRLGNIKNNQESTITGSAMMALEEQVEVDSKSKWEETIKLPAFDNNGNPYYYYAVESEVLRNGNDITTTFEISYLADEDSNTITITNKEKKVILPETGGIGKWAYIVLGVVIMLTSCGGFYIIIFGRKRKKDKAA